MTTSTRALDRTIWRIAWPAIVANISIPLLGLVDSAILGHLESSRYLGAVAVGAAVLAFVYWGFSFLRMGTTGPVALAEGAGDHYGAFLVLVRSSIVALVISILVLLGHRPLFELAMGLMAPAPELAPLALSYTGIRVASAPAVLVTYTVVGWCIGRQDTRWPLLIAVATNFINIVLDGVFVIAMGLASDGAALATVIAEYLGCALALYAVWRARPALDIAQLLVDLKIASAYKLVLTSNRHLFFRTLCLLSSFAFFTAVSDNFGADTLAANTLLMQLLLVAAYGMDGIAFAAEGLAGNCLGGGQLGAFHRVVRRCALWTLATAVVVSAGLLALREPLLAAVTNLESVRALMRAYFPWLVALPLLAAPSYLLDGVFIGSAQSRHMMTTMLFSALGVYLPVWYLSSGWGNHGLWLAFALFNLARGLTLFGCFQNLSRRNAWLAAPQQARACRDRSG